MARQRRKPEELRPVVRRAPVEEVTIFEVTEEELEGLARGTDESTFLNLAIFMWTIGLSFLLAITTTTIQSQQLFIVYAIITVVGIAMGVVLIVFWWKRWKSRRSLVDRIKQRLQPKPDDATK